MKKDRRHWQREDHAEQRGKLFFLLVGAVIIAALAWKIGEWVWEKIFN